MGCTPTVEPVGGHRRRRPGGLQAKEANDMAPNALCRADGHLPMGVKLECADGRGDTQDHQVLGANKKDHARLMILKSKLQLFERYYQ